MLFAASVLAVYWLQPALPVRNLDFGLPTASIGLAAAVWIVTARKRAPAGEAATPAGSAGSRMAREDWIALLVLGLAISALALTRYLNLGPILTAARPPEFIWVLSGLAIAIVFLGGLWFFAPRRWLPVAGILVLLALFAVVKNGCLHPGRVGESSGGWRGNPRNSPRPRYPLAGVFLHRVPADPCPPGPDDGQPARHSLREFITYGIFFPAVTAGPIDRVERFVKDLRAAPGALAGTMAPGGERVLIGDYSKIRAGRRTGDPGPERRPRFPGTPAPPWMWFFLYAYAFRIYFDFSGYTDIALGLGRWAGIALPENFNRPYLQPNLTAFWNSWHITLAQWFRSYFFYPLTRALRSGPRPLPVWSDHPDRAAA